MPEGDALGEERGNRFQVLCYEQVDRLHRVMETSIPIHGRGNFPTLEIKLKDLVQVVQTNLKSDGIQLRDVRLNGGAASYILGSDTVESYNDLDLIFGLKLSGQGDLQKIKDVVMRSLLDFLPKGVNKAKMTAVSINEAYVHKMVKIYTDSNKWSLISLSNARGRNVELKFADTMRRQFEFSVDSFQISSPAQSITEHFYPTVVAESVYGDFNIALYHLNNKLIATRAPEEIRGGGLLKYCYLLVRGYKPTSKCDVGLLERYMCSRFFIDFNNIADQRVKLTNYLSDHFVGDDSDDTTKYRYLETLYAVVRESTICLMGHERRETLDLIQGLARNVLRECERRAYAKMAAMSQFDAAQTFPSFDPNGPGSNLIIDQVYYGPYSSVSYPGAEPQHYYTVYTYEYSATSSPSGSGTSSPTCSLSPIVSPPVVMTTASPPVCCTCCETCGGGM